MNAEWPCWRVLDRYGIEADDRSVAWVLDANEAIDVMEDVADLDAKARRTQQAQEAIAAGQTKPAKPAGGRRRPLKPRR